MDKSSILVCERCGSKDIEQRAWANANTGKISDYISGDIEDNWCSKCGEHVYFTSLEEWEKHLEEDED